MEQIAREAGRTVRIALGSWSTTARLVLIMSAGTAMMLAYSLLQQQ
jgi:hypothetical protein